MAHGPHTAPSGTASATGTHATPPPDRLRGHRLPAASAAIGTGEPAKGCSMAGAPATRRGVPCQDPSPGPRVASPRPGGRERRTEDLGGEQSPWEERAVRCWQTAADRNGFVDGATP